MLIKTIKYTDYLETEREEKFYFDLNETELMRMNMKADGRMGNILEDIAKAKNYREMMEKFEQIIFAAYGELTDDGRRLKKSEEISKAFAETPAYNALILEFIDDEKKISDFVNQVFPKPQQQDDKPKLQVVRDETVTSRR